MSKDRKTLVTGVIGADAHNIDGLDDVNYGQGIARKGWLEAGDLLNCLPAEEVIAWQESKRSTTASSS
jgi:DNA polymerase (family 10)